MGIAAKIAAWAIHRVWIFSINPFDLPCDNPYRGILVNFLRSTQPQLRIQRLDRLSIRRDKDKEQKATFLPICLPPKENTNSLRALVISTGVLRHSAASIAIFEPVRHDVHRIVPQTFGPDST